MENLLNYKLNYYDAYVFDLDNTLYSEKEYLFGAYMEISKFLDKYNNEKIYNYFIEVFKNEGRTEIFNKVCKKFSFEYYLIPCCLEILRNYKPPKLINLYSDMYTLMLTLKEKNKALFILTNGNVTQQKNKINNINWGKLVSDITCVFANEFEAKPSNESLEFLIDKYKLNRSKILFIGDSEVDKKCAARSNIDFLLKNKNNK